MNTEEKNTVEIAETATLETTEIPIQYPTAPDAEGFYIEDVEQQEVGVLTKEYENGSKVKKVTLSNGNTAIIRMLKGRDFVEAKKRMQADNTLDMETVGMSLATKINDKQQPPEYYLDDLYQNDYIKLLIAYLTINLQ